MTRFILIRHGETSWTEKKRYQGWSDIKLSPRGKKNIAMLSKSLKNFKIDRLFASPLKRALESARIISLKIGVRPMVDSKLKEINFGEWEGKTSIQLLTEGNKNYHSWISGKKATPRGGESLFALRQRVRSFLSRCVKKYSGETIAIVSHGGVVRMMLLEFLRLPDRHLFSFQIDPASYTVVVQDARRISPFVTCLNIKAAEKKS